MLFRSTVPGNQICEFCRKKQLRQPGTVDAVVTVAKCKKLPTRMCRPIVPGKADSSSLRRIYISKVELSPERVICNVLFETVCRSIVTHDDLENSAEVLLAQRSQLDVDVFHDV